VDRLACLELPAFPLQLALRAHPDWRAQPGAQALPVAVIERDAPHAPVLWVNDGARAAGILPGQRYVAALGLSSRLRAAVVAPSEIERGVAELVHELQRFSPEVEPCADEPGVFWLGARGLERLFGAPRRWAGAILAHVAARGFEARVAVGFRHFGAYAGVKACSRSPITVFEDRAGEARAAAGLGLDRLPLEPATRDALAKLAVASLGELARLPAGGVLERFGAGAYRLHRMAAGALDQELAPAPERVPLEAHVDLEHGAGHGGGGETLDSILACAAELAAPMCAELARSGEAAAEIALELRLDDGSALEERVTPARPTCDVNWLMRLLRLRLASRSPFEGATGATGGVTGAARPTRPTRPTRIERVGVTLARAPARSEQGALFQEARSRPRRAAAKAFSALRASFGEEAVVRARGASAHLPEHSFTWERCDELARAAPAPVRGPSCAPPLVRVLLDAPLELPPRGRREPDGWLLRGVTHGSVARLLGPYRLSGGWWRSETRRDYYFAELSGGEIAWIFHDLVRRRWFLQGSVS
jgi:protein ImuB